MGIDAHLQVFLDDFFDLHTWQIGCCIVLFSVSFSLKHQQTFPHPSLNIVDLNSVTNNNTKLCTNYITGLLCQDWDVAYTPREVCALVGSTMYVNCTYTYPSDNQVELAFWFQGCTDSDPKDGSLEKAFGRRLEYLGNKENNCSLKIKDLRQTDAAKYCFRFVTNKQGGKWTGTPGVSLTVTGNLAAFIYIFYIYILLVIWESEIINGD